MIFEVPWQKNIRPYVMWPIHKMHVDKKQNSFILFQRIC